MKSKGFRSIVSICASVGVVWLIGVLSVSTAFAAGGSSKNTVYGASASSDDWRLTLGVRSWYNEWNLPVTITGQGGKFYNYEYNYNTDNYTDKSVFSNTNGSQILSFESSSELVFIPAFSVYFQDFYVGGSYFPEQKYKFKEQFGWSDTWQSSGTWTDLGGHAHVFQYNEVGDYSFAPVAKRSEWDINFGYNVTPNLSLSVGYKNLDRKYDYTATAVGDGTYTYTIDGVPQDTTKYEYKWSPTMGGSKLTVDTLILGLNGTAPLGEGTSLEGLNMYGTLAYGWPKFKEKYYSYGALTHTDSYNGQYYFMELGLNYAIPTSGFLKGVVLNGGYRYQRLNANSKDSANGAKSGDWNDVAQGFSFGVTAAF